MSNAAPSCLVVLCIAALWTTPVPAAPGGSLLHGAGQGNVAITPEPRKPHRPARPLPASFTAVIEQATGQADPAAVEPVVFDVRFGQAVDPASFDAADLVSNGTAAIATWTILNSGDDRNFTVSASGLTAGTIIPTLAAGSVENGAGGSNLASGGADHSVTFALPPCATSTYLYAAGWSPPEIKIYCVLANGHLNLEGTVNAPFDVRDMQPSADGNNLYYASSDLTRYTVSADGSLFEVATAAVGNGTFNDLTLDPSGRYLYGTHSQSFGRIFVYDTQSPTATPALLQTVAGSLYLPRGIAVRPSGSHLHVANYLPQELYTYPLNANGTIQTSSLTKTNFDARPNYLAVSPLLPLVYWTEVPGGSVLTGQFTGSNVSLADTIFSGFGARPLVINAAGSQLYVANNNTDDISVFQIDGTGDLTSEQLQPTARRPEHVILHPNGGYLYAASAGDYGDLSTISIYRVEADGTLTDLGAPAFTPQGIYRLAIIER